MASCGSDALAVVVLDPEDQEAVLAEAATLGAALRGADRSLLLAASLPMSQRQRLGELIGAQAPLREITEHMAPEPGQIYLPPPGQTPILQRHPERRDRVAFGLRPAGSAEADPPAAIIAASAAGQPGGVTLLAGARAGGGAQSALASLERMVEAGQAGFWDWHVQDNTAFMSPRLKAMLGFSGGELGTNAEAWQRRVHPDDLPRLQQVFRAHVESRGETAFDLELRYLHRDGSTVWGHCRGQVVAWGPSGAPLRMMGLLSDITELRRREAALDEIRHFAFMAAHDLMAPANTIAGGLSMLRASLGEELDADAAQIFEFATRAADQLRARITSVVELFRIENTQVTFEPVDLGACFREAADWLRDEIQRSGAELTIAPLPQASGAPMLIGQVAQNLLGNALKYRHPARPPRLRVTTFDAGADMVGIRVSDNGRGIPPDQREKVFELFHRLRPGAALGGSGLGLTLCERVVALHGGRIWVEAGDEGGAALLFTLPRDGGPAAG